MKGHSPHGECGLKSSRTYNKININLSLPARGVWVEIEAVPQYGDTTPSLPARGVWVEIVILLLLDATPVCHSPHGECGLKFVLSKSMYFCTCHSPHGECGLKFERRPRIGVHLGHSPHGECGLKYIQAKNSRNQAPVTPRTGSVG